MDGLSAAANVITVASLAVQLSESIKKLIEFWTSIKNAPDDIHAITTDLQILSSILTRIALEAQRSRPDPSLIAALSSCFEKIKKLKIIVDDLESGFRSSSPSVRRWNTLKTLFKSDRLKDFQDSLERTKSSLMLIQNIHQGSYISRQHDLQLQRLATMAQNVSELNLKYSSNPVSTFSSIPSDIRDHTTALQTEKSRMASTMPDPIRCSQFELGMNSALQETLGRLGRVSSGEEMESSDFHSCRREQGRKSANVDRPYSKRPFWMIRNVRRNDFVLTNFIGTFYIGSRIIILESFLSVDDLNDGENIEYEHVTSFCACPAPWLVKLGINYGLKVNFNSSAIWGWKCALNTFREVPDDAMIFEFCKEGNLSGVQALFQRGIASVKDTDSCGRTALYYAAANHRTQLCKFLIQAGADKNARIFQDNNLTPWEPITPVMAAASFIGQEAFKATQCIDTLRLFTDCFDFSDHDSDGWHVLFAQHSITIRDPCDKELYLPLHWTISSFSSELKDNFDDVVDWMCSS